MKRLLLATVIRAWRLQRRLHGKLPEEFLGTGALPTERINLPACNGLVATRAAMKLSFAKTASTTGVGASSLRAIGRRHTATASALSSCLTVAPCGPNETSGGYKASGMSRCLRSMTFFSSIPRIPLDDTVEKDPTAELRRGTARMISRAVLRLECGVGFRQLRTCRLTRLGQLCAETARPITHLVGADKRRRPSPRLKLSDL